MTGARKNGQGRRGSFWTHAFGILIGGFLLVINCIWTYLISAGLGNEVPACGRRTRFTECHITANDDPRTQVVGMWVMIVLAAFVWLSLPGRGIMPGVAFLTLAAVITVGHSHAVSNQLSAPDYSLHAGIALCIGAGLVINGIIRTSRHRRDVSAP